MLTSRGEDTVVKLIDFGISRSYFNFEVGRGAEILRMQSLAGTTPYMAPEVFRRNYSNSCDIWSLGVILYIILSGYAPFGGETDDEIEDKIIDVDYDFDDHIWEDVSDSAKDLISLMIAEETERITPKEALQHEWFTEVSIKPETKSSDVLVDRLIRFQN